ncbi:MAG: hypothetical protein KDA28_15325, partial [Phycisphaerales bacterium]|nr:hypothetical protein [Phycisphaerales bacterium]
MGPWFIRDEARPFQPGCNYEVVRRLVARGRLTPNTVLRGPTTRQFWTLAKRTPSVANLLGLCHSCQEKVDPADYMCRSCGAVFTPETDRQHLGLGPVHLLPGEAPPDRIARQVGDRGAPQAQGGGGGSTNATPGTAPIAPAARPAAPPSAPAPRPSPPPEAPTPEASSRATTLESTVRSQRLLLAVVVPVAALLLGTAIVVLIAPSLGWTLGPVDR